MGTTLNCSGVQLDNRKAFFVHQVLGPNFLSVFFLFNKQYTYTKFNKLLEMTNKNISS